MKGNSRIRIETFLISTWVDVLYNKVEYTKHTQKPCYPDPIRAAEQTFKSISSETQSLTFSKTKRFREILCVLKHRRCLTSVVHEMYMSTSPQQMYNLISSLFAMKIYQRTLEIFYDFVLGCYKKC